MASTAKEALIEQVKRFSEHVAFVMWSKGCQRSDAEDVVAKIIAKVWEQLSECTAADEVNEFFSQGALKYRAIDNARARTRREKAADDLISFGNGIRRPKAGTE